MSPLLILFTGAFILALVQYLTRPDPLRDVPGPWLAKYTPLLLAYHTRTGKRYLFVDALHKRYGPVVRLGPRHVSCASAGAPGIIYAQGTESLPKSRFYEAFYVDGTASLFSTQDRAGHAQKRRVLAHSFSYASVRGFERWMRASLRKLVGGLDKTEFVDILMWLNYMTFDVISDLAFGQPLGMLDRASDVLPELGNDTRPRGGNTHGVAAMIDHRGRAAAFLGLFPTLLFLARFVPPAWIPDTFLRKGLSGTEDLSRIARRCVKQRLSSSSQSPSPFDKEQRGDLLDRLVDGMRRVVENRDAQSKVVDQETVTEDDIVTEAMLLLTAGSDTTANSTAAILFHIFRNPRVLTKLRAELEDAVRCGNAPPMIEWGVDEDANDGLVWFDQIKSVRYLQATIDEGLRRFATNAFGLPRVVPPGASVHISGHTFGEGTELSVPAYTIQHDPKIWGDSEVFRPERWLEQSVLPASREATSGAAAETAATGDKVTTKTAAELRRYLLTFGMGPRACIGKNLAYMQMQLLVATLVLRYDMELRDSAIESVEGFMHKPVDVWVRLKKREWPGRIHG